VRWGRLNVESLAFAIPDDFDFARATVSLDHTVVRSSYTLKNGRVEIKLSKAQIVNEDQTLEVVIHRKEK